MSRIRIIIFGCQGVGKSSITIQLVCNYFEENYDPTIQDSYRTSIFVDREMVLLDVLDTAGDEEFPMFYEEYIRSSNGFVIVYSITSNTTFLNVDMFRNYIYRVLEKDLSEHIPIVLCGNKCDLELERQVFTNDAKKVADEWKMLFYETSAKNNTNIIEMFQGLVINIKTNINFEDVIINISKDATK
ncbi:hypothetical protein EIN_191220 [Entamoeba invadens IP1]|uniref:Uncharacterized protein n=1 Tax=Entamoeba invadens IP1 TaxID=370355 RepID=A0A0A1U7G3_ENTIV|nr:hypothetical protein EIN_191220 [Entamoeba invadens IP1]ELP90342.1 hypothetical protein EIN_191220 [Entamoeba invadens IP1]|eukprot:XP_004257113.1 hypothetical protein EIN_191220 [Entamoeba invadens IP1]